MGIATVFVIPSNIEPWFWLLIFGECAFLIARGRSSLHFLHGLPITYIANHSKDSDDEVYAIAMPNKKNQLPRQQHGKQMRKEEKEEIASSWVIIH